MGSDAKGFRMSRIASTAALVWFLWAAASCDKDAVAPVTPPPPPPPPADTTPAAPDTATTPTQASSALLFGDVTPTSLALSWTNGDGDKRLVLMRQGAPVDALPNDGEIYSADSVFALGDEIGTGNWVVFDGPENGVFVTGLAPDRVYHVTIVEYNGDSTDTKYLDATVGASSQVTPTVPSLTGSWLWGAAGAQLSAVVTFLSNSTYMVVDDGVADDGGQPGMERGTYFWDDNGMSQGSLTTSPTTDTSGDWGLSPPGPKTLAVRNDSLTVTVEGDVSVAIRVNPSDTNELVGAWLLQDPADANRILVLTILDDIHYMLGADDVADSNQGPGLERGTYQWNSSNGAFTSAAATDTNGNLGLSPLIQSGTATVSGDTLVYVSAGGPIALLRIR